MPELKVLVCVISFNEEDNISKTLADLNSAGHDYDIVVVDNASNDKTQEVCRKLGVPLISHCVNTGGSVGTLMTYFIYAYHEGYDVLCQFDGDGQHLAEELPKIIQPIADGEANCVIGSRFIENKGFQSTFLRRIGIRTFSQLLSLMVGQPFTDITSGFRAYDRRVIELFGKKYTNELYDSMCQFILICHYAGMKISEVPVLMRSREHGASEFSIAKSIAFPLKSLIVILASYLQRRKLAKTFD